MSAKWIIAGAGICLIAGFSAGFLLAHWRGEKNLSDLRLAHSEAVLAAQEAEKRRFLEIQAENEKTLQSYAEEKNRLESANTQLAADADVMREQLAASSLRAARTATACNADSGTADRLAKCESLLGESLGLLSEGEGLLGRVNSRANALIELKN